jgi:hypothetical protein
MSEQTAREAVARISWEELDGLSTEQAWVHADEVISALAEAGFVIGRAPKPIETAPMDGTEIVCLVRQTYRWLPYKPSSEQFRHGLKGRWQKANEYGGWDNASPPEGWLP